MRNPLSAASSMFSLRAGAPGNWRILWLCSLPRLPIQTCHPGPRWQRLSQRRQLHGTPQSKAISRPTPLPKSPTFRFSRLDVPPISHWQGLVQLFGPGGLSAEDFHWAATQYCAVAVKNSSTWKGKLQRGKPLRPALRRRKRKSVALSQTQPATRLRH